MSNLFGINKSLNFDFAFNNYTPNCKLMELSSYSKVIIFTEILVCLDMLKKYSSPEKTWFHN